MLFELRRRGFVVHIAVQKADGLNLALGLGPKLLSKLAVEQV